MPQAVLCKQKNGQVKQEPNRAAGTSVGTAVSFFGVQRRRKGMPGSLGSSQICQSLKHGSTGCLAAQSSDCEFL